MSKPIVEPPEEHPSYGAITLSRLTWGSGGAELFGSSIRHGTVMRLVISRADLRREYYEDRHRAREPLIEVDMSPVQFAEFITASGLGSGVPCTLRRIAGEPVPEPAFESKREQFVGEFREKAAAVATGFDALIAELESLLDKPAVTKAERRSLLARLGRLKTEIASNMPFIASQFNEQMDRTVHEAKGEVEAFVSGMVQRTGLEALRTGMLQLGAEKGDADA